MEQVLSEALRQVPSLVVLVVLVVQFLRALDRRDETIRSIAESAHAAQASATAAINENSDALSKGSDKAAEYIQSLRLAIADLEDPSVLGKAGRRLQQFGADLNAEQSAEILRLETLKANTEKAAQAREDARRKAESSARQQASASTSSLLSSSAQMIFTRRALATITSWP